MDSDRRIVTKMRRMLLDGESVPTVLREVQRATQVEQSNRLVPFCYLMDAFLLSLTIVQEAGDWCGFGDTGVTDAEIHKLLIGPILSNRDKWSAEL